MEEAITSIFKTTFSLSFIWTNKRTLSFCIFKTPWPYVLTIGLPYPISLRQIALSLWPIHSCFPYRYRMQPSACAISSIHLTLCILATPCPASSTSLLPKQLVRSLHALPAQEKIGSSSVTKIPQLYLYKLDLDFVGLPQISSQTRHKWCFLKIYALNYALTPTFSTILTPHVFSTLPCPTLPTKKTNSEAKLHWLIRVPRFVLCKKQM